MWDRRRLLAAGGGGLAGLAAWPVCAQEPVPTQEPPFDQAALDVLPNLITRMAVIVGLNGVSNHPFVVDTGANRTGIALETAEALGLPPGPQVLVNGVTAAEPTPTVRLDRLFLGGRTFQNLILPVFPRARLGVDGLLGVDVLGSFAVTFDIPASQLTLYRRRVSLSRSRGSRLDNQIVLNGRQRFGQLTLVRVSADGVPVQAFIDSGSQYSIGNMALFNSVAARRPDVNDRRWTVPVIGATGDSVTGELAVIRRVNLGGVTLNELPTIFCDLHAFRIWRMDDRPAMLFGADILRMFESVTVDFPERQVRFGAPLGARG